MFRTFICPTSGVFPVHAAMVYFIQLARRIRTEQHVCLDTAIKFFFYMILFKTRFEELCWLYKLCIFISSIVLSETFLIVQWVEWVVIIYVDRYIVQYVILFTDFKETWILFRPIFKESRKSYFMKSCLVGTKLLHEEDQQNRRTDFTESVYILGNF